MTWRNRSASSPRSNTNQSTTRRSHEPGNQGQADQQEARQTVRPGHGQSPCTQVHPGRRPVLHQVRSELEGVHSSLRSAIALQRQNHSLNIQEKLSLLRTNILHRAFRREGQNKERRTMSHFVSIQTQIKDIEALRSACAELGFGFDENAQARGIGTEQRGDYVIRLKGPCDIAVQRQPDGTFGLSTDWWGGHVEREV